MEYLKSHKKQLLLTIIGSIILVLLTLGLYHWYISKVTPKVLPVDPPKVVTTTTSVKAVPKVSATDNDVELTQVYRANVNGAAVEIPVETKENIKGVITQTVDLTPVTQLQKELDKKEFKKNWEISAGVGIHDGDIYIPLEVQRNYKVDKAIAIEVHVKPDISQPKINGGEVKHVWLF